MQNVWYQEFSLRTGCFLFWLYFFFSKFNEIPNQTSCSLLALLPHVAIPEQYTSSKATSVSDTNTFRKRKSRSGPKTLPIWLFYVLGESNHRLWLVSGFMQRSRFSLSYWGGKVVHHKCSDLWSRFGTEPRQTFLKAQWVWRCLTSLRFPWI